MFLVQTRRASPLHLATGVREHRVIPRRAVFAREGSVFFLFFDASLRLLFLDPPLELDSSRPPLGHPSLAPLDRFDLRLPRVARRAHGRRVARVVLAPRPERDRVIDLVRALESGATRATRPSLGRRDPLLHDLRERALRPHRETESTRRETNVHKYVSDVRGFSRDVVAI